MRIKILSTILLTLVFFTVADAQTLDKAKLDRFFDRLAEKNQAMGSLTVAKDGKVLYSRAIGYSQINGSQRKPATTASRYRIGSITKTFTASACFSACRGRKIKAFGHARQILPADPNAGKITIEHILTHRSGIHDFIREPDFRAWSLTRERKTRRSPSLPGEA
jgi:CubicO group peptidase (beta-lactamase class C family)